MTSIKIKWRIFSARSNKKSERWNSRFRFVPSVVPQITHAHVKVAMETKQILFQEAKMSNFFRVTDTAWYPKNSQKKSWKIVLIIAFIMVLIILKGDCEVNANFMLLYNWRNKFYACANVWRRYMLYCPLFSSKNIMCLKKFLRKVILQIT